MAQAVLDNTPAAPLLQSIVGPAPTALYPDIDGVDGFLSIGLATHQEIGAFLPFSFERNLQIILVRHLVAVSAIEFETDCLA
jgi:hypothetical protein